jgi:hypothetical protein
MKFRTEINVEKAFDLQPDQKILTLGSCFADRMGERLQEAGLDCLVNPFGVIYNPLSISSLLKMSLNQSPAEDAWVEQGGRWVNTGYHGSVSGATKAEAINNAAQIHQSVDEYLREASLLIITFGTAYAYEEVASKLIVANCHRLPAENFKRRLLSVKEITEEYHGLLELLHRINKKLKVIFTVSPVRHVRDSLVENQLSKSTLNVATHDFSGVGENYYFPSYELMMDDLRDYRYYEENLVQPNAQALTYISEKFADFCFSNQMQAYMKDAEKLKRRMSHKVMQNGAEAEKFTSETEKMLQAFKKKYPFSRIN